MTVGQTFRNTLVVLLTIAAAYTLMMSLRILIVLLIAIIIASAIRPTVHSLERRGISPIISILFIYSGLAILILLLSVAVFPPVVNQVVQYMGDEGRLAARIVEAQSWVESIISDVADDEISLVGQSEIEVAVADMLQQFRRVMPSLINDLGTTIGEAILIFVMGAYWLTSHEKATNFVVKLAAPRYRDSIEIVIDEIEETVGAYVRGTLVIAFSVGFLNFALMSILGIPNALTLAFIIGMTTMIPMIGGVLGMVITVIFTLVSSPQYVIGVFLISLLVQQIEAYYLGPRVMSNHVGLDPLLVIVYTSIGFVMFGIIGALIAVPVMSTGHILLTQLVILPHQKNIRPLRTEDGLPVISGEEAEEFIEEASFATLEGSEQKSY